MDTFSQALHEHYMEMMTAQSEELGALKERLRWIERRLGIADERPECCKVVKVDFRSLRVRGTGVGS